MNDPRPFMNTAPRAWMTVIIEGCIPSDRRLVREFEEGIVAMIAAERAFPDGHDLTVSEQDWHLFFYGYSNDFYTTELSRHISEWATTNNKLVKTTFKNLAEQELEEMYDGTIVGSM